MKRRIWAIGLTAAILIAMGICLAILSGHIFAGRKQENKNELHVVILDSENYFYSDSGIEHGIEMALADISDNTGAAVTYEIIDDGGNYVNGIAKAKMLAADDMVDIVISFQNFASIGSEVSFFEEAKKPFIVTMGCYDNVAQSGCQYFITDFLSGRAIGARLGQLIKKQGLQRIATCHSDTIFERDEIRGLQSVINNVKTSRIYGSMVGPYNDEELSSLLVQCDALNIDGVVVNFYDQEDSAWLLGQLGKADRKMTLMGDYALDSSEILEQYGKDLEGVYIVPSYPYEESDKLDDFVLRYEAYSGEHFSTAAVQYYDLFCMLADAGWKDGQKLSGTQIMETVKSKQGYEGIAGKIRFDRNGCLQTSTCPVFVCHNGEFVVCDKIDEEGN